MKLFSIFCVITACFWSAPTFAQTDFSHWDKHELVTPMGEELISPAGGPLIKMQSYSRTNLEAAARNKLDKYGAGTKEQIEYAMSILSLSMMWDETFDGQTLSGLVQASDGPYSFKASLSPRKDKFTLALVATDDDGKVLDGADAAARRIAGTTSSATVAKRLAQTSASSIPQKRSTKSYRAPESVAEMDRWASIGTLTKSQNPKDPLAPRYYLVQTGPKYGVTDFASAIEALPSASPLKLRGRPTIEVLDAWKSYDGSKAGLVMQQTEIQWQPGVIVLFMTQKKGQRDIIYFGYEVTEATFLNWGGITRMMKLRKVIPSMDAFPQSKRRQIARAPFKQQTELYEAGLNKVLENGAAAMFAMSQSQSLMRMQELNYDLLLGGDITSPMIAD